MIDCCFFLYIVKSNYNKRINLQFIACLESLLAILGHIFASEMAKEVMNGA